MDCISGYKIEFVQQPVQLALPRPVKCSKDMFQLMDLEIERLLNVGAVVTSSHKNDEFISPIFAVPKPNGEIRLILNLKSFNQFVAYEHFKMEHLTFVTDLVLLNDFAASIDLADAYFSLPIHPEHWKYLKFQWKGQLFAYTVLVFGLSSSPRIFTRITKPILAKLRSQFHIRCSIFIDDIIIFNKTEAGLIDNFDKVSTLFSSLGFQINWKKSVTKPSHRVIHLGYVIDTTKLDLSLPANKCTDLHTRCLKVLSKRNDIKIREVAKLVGSFNAFCQAAKWGRLYIRHIEKCLNIALIKNRRDYEGLMSLSHKAIEDIHWWLSDEALIPKYFGHHEFNLTIESDASRLGWGGHYSGQMAGGRWDVFEQSKHINWLELKALDYTLRSFVHKFSNVTILARIDNTCAISYIRKQGGVIADLNELAKSIWLWCKKKNIWLIPCYIPSSVNCIADSKSRIFTDNTEWSLNDSVYTDICNKFGHGDVDLFASRLNHKVAKYVSWEPDPFSIAVDAFVLNWSHYNLCYCFPPFNMIGRVLSKCIHDRAELLLIVPRWETQLWFPLLCDITIEYMELPIARSTVRLPFKQESVHPIWNRLFLSCYRITGNGKK